MNDHFFHTQENQQPILDFGEPIPLDTVAEYGWLWEFRGRLSIIATPFREGYHYAQRPTDFIPIIEHLEHLHSFGLVHGDIRAYNMVVGSNDIKQASSTGNTIATSVTTDIDDPIILQSKTKAIKERIRVALTKLLDRMRIALSVHSCTRPIASIRVPQRSSTNDFDASSGCLIDFDFGGKQGPTTIYPSGYNRLLTDGYRIGHAGNIIQYQDDWHALIMVIFQVHVFYPPTDIDVPMRVYQYFAKQAEDVVVSLCVTGATDAVTNERAEKAKPTDIFKLKRFLRDMESVGYKVSKRA
jgi:serine/threonine protein kinase